MPWPYSASPRTSAGPALVDDWLPDGAWKLEHHALEMSVPPEVALAALADLRQGEIPIVRALMSMRGIPVGETRSLGEFFSTPPFVTLAEEPGRELVGGIAGPFWHFGRGRLPADLPSTPEAFRAALDGGRIAAIATFRADPLPSGGSRLWTETWAYAPARGDRRLFTAYWLLIGPFSAWIRRMFLTAARRRAVAAEA
jgi:hypothetical protein